MHLVCVLICGGGFVCSIGLLLRACIAGLLQKGHMVHAQKSFTVPYAGEVKANAAQAKTAQHSCS